ncbi:MAG: adenylyltransferase [Thermoprotei archaeon]|nr:MAG: adenylyltransferase [Thermoprotei archaeon]
MNTCLSPEELERYSRQIMVFGEEGQKKLKKSKVLVVGVGGLGSSVLYYLAAVGVGKLIIVDKEKVELSNLNRQIIHTTKDIGKEKAKSAEEKLRELNPNIDIEAYSTKFNEDLAKELIPKIDVAIDALDNWDTRIILNKYCVKYKKPLVHAGVRESYGQLMVIIPGKGPCLHCVFPRKPREEHPFPILGPIPGVLGALEALEAIKIITGYGKPAVGKLLIFDGKNLTIDIINVQRNPNCPICSKLY